MRVEESAALAILVLLLMVPCSATADRGQLVGTWNLVSLRFINLPGWPPRGSAGGATCLVI
jgi:hypothetical protein